MKIKKNKKKSIVQFFTPVPYIRIQGEDDLIIVSLSQLMEAQKKATQAEKRAYQKGYRAGKRSRKKDLQKVVENWRGFIPYELNLNNPPIRCPNSECYLDQKHTEGCEWYGWRYGGMVSAQKKVLKI